MATAAPRLAVGQLCRGQLPAEVTGFVGRQPELACLAGLLPAARLVTVTGPGGVGKTRVALRAAAAAEAQFGDGTCFVDLSEVRDPSRVTATVADCLGLRNADDLPAVLGHLRRRRVLLVLDTCEHLVDACASFTETLVREVPGVTVLATSREPFDIPGEHTIPVPPLPVPGPGGVPDAAAALGPRGDAIELFAQRAAAASPSFRLTEETLPYVIRLCRRLDGIPLALELAAVRLRALPLPELLDRLEHRFHMLDGGRRGAVPRHQTLRTAIGWSYDLCTPAERTLWARLSVFAGTFNVTAAESVCAGPRADGVPGDRHSEIIGPLIGLVDKSVVLRDNAGGNRYRLPGTLRAFGSLRLEGSGEEAGCRERHLSFFLTEARRLAEERTGEAQRARLAGLRSSHDDLEAALSYDPGGPLATALGPYWLISGRLREGRAWLDQVIDASGEPGRPSSGRGGQDGRARALIARAGLLALGGEAAAGAEDARAGIRIAAGLGSRPLEARGYLSLHAALTFGGWEADAAAAGAEADQRLSETGDDAGLMMLGAQQAHLLQLTGSPDDALGQCERTLRRLRDDGPWWLRGCLYAIAALACVQLPGAEDRCTANAVQGLRAAREADDVITIAYALEALAWNAAAAGRLERAAWLAGAADPLWQRTGARLSGTPILLESHDRAVKASADGLGARRFEALRGQGSACGLETALAAAADDADELPGRTVRARPADDAPPAIPGVQPPKQSELTSREREIAALVAEGLSNREIAAKLVISKRTVDAHVEHIFGKLGLSSRVQLTLWLRDTRERGQRPGKGRATAARPPKTVSSSAKEP
ncbi:MAG: LuxR C-terminal-related transcriptional regulator [Streptosporangiales bacterium]|nr:LuxR C-terminal-related transcriptional regulator [Streptosporangiales bacterium]